MLTFLRCRSKPTGWLLNQVRVRFAAFICTLVEYFLQINLQVNGLAGNEHEFYTWYVELLPTRIPTVCHSHPFQLLLGFQKATGGEAVRLILIWRKVCTVAILRSSKVFML